MLGRKIEQKEVFGETVHIRSLNGGAEAAKIIDLLQQVESKPSLIAELGALMVVACLCDETGERLYQDVETVKEEASIGFLAKFVEVALEISGLDDDSEQVRKNLQAVQ